MKPHRHLILSSQLAIGAYRRLTDVYSTLVGRARADLAKSSELLKRSATVAPSGDQAPSPEQLADEFAAKAVQSVLAPSPGGIEVFEEIARGTGAKRR